jgi:general secretion pathway protein F
MLPALTSARSAVGNRHIGSGIEASLEAVRDGQSLGRALSGRPSIPQVALRMIKVGEETGKLDEMLLRAAAVLEQQSQRRIERLMTLLTPALTIAIAGLVGALILTVMNAILSVNELAVQ